MKIINLLVILLLIGTPCFSQEKSKKQTKEERSLEKQKQIETIVNAKEFVFVARTALPMGMRQVDMLSRVNSVKFHPDLIVSDMPFFGETYRPSGYGTDSGLRFEGKPEKFTITKSKKKYQITAEVPTSADHYQLNLSIDFEGSGTLSVNCNNRSFISYIGEISPLEKAK